jgi:signal transduction histidine kinase
VAFEVADVRFSTQIAKQSLRTAFVFTVTLLVLLLSERFTFQSGTEQAANRLAAAVKARNEIIFADEKLTMSAIAYAYSNNKDWKTRYQATVPQFDAALGAAKSLASTEDAEAFDQLTKESRVILAELEQTAFDLIEDGWSQDAPAMFTSPRYLKNKKTVVEGTDRLIARMDAQAQDAINGLRMRSWVIIGLGVLTGIIGAILMWRRLTNALSKAEAAFTQADAAYHQQLANAHLASIKQTRMEQLGALTATVAHELRNPLGAVRTSAFVLKRKFGTQDDAVARSFDRIEHGITRCDNLISQLIDYVRAPDLNKTEQDMDGWLENVVTELSKSLNELISLQCTLGLNGRSVEFDPVRLKRAVGSILTNASEAMVNKDGEVSTDAAGMPKIMVETRMTERGAEIVVADNGPGISPGNVEKAMEPLFTTKSFGAGLGLPAAQRILEQHGGGIELTSNPGQGVRVAVWIPTPMEGEENRDSGAKREAVV